MSETITQLIDTVLELDEKATPGEWAYSECSICAQDRQVKNLFDIVVADTTPVRDVPSLLSDKECLANAALISYYRTSAPRLARALKHAMTYFEWRIKDDHRRGEFNGAAEACIKELDRILSEPT